MKYLLIALPLYIISCGGNSSNLSEEQIDRMTDEMIKDMGYDPPKKSTNELSELAAACAQLEVKELLKSPTSAEFNSTPTVTPINDTVFGVSGNVDSQNSFGAMIRSNFMCIVTFTDNAENYIVSDLAIE